MTAQYPDTIRVENVTFTIAGVRGGGLFNPRDAGLAPTSRSTACSRGYVCHYSIEDDRLVLDALVINNEGTPPDLFGRSPDVFGTPRHGQYEAEYANLARPVLFSGRILAGRDFIPELYVHSGFHPAWKFREVRELRILEGKLIADRDHSAEVAAFRERRIAEATQPDGAIDRHKLFRDDYWPISPERAEALANALVLHIMAEQNPYIAWQLAKEWAELMVVARRAPWGLAPEQIRIVLRHTFDDLYGPSFPQLTPTYSPYKGPREYLDGTEVDLVRPLIPVGFEEPFLYEEIGPPPPQKTGSRLASDLRDPLLGQEFAYFVRWHMEQQRAKVPGESYTEGFHFEEACHAYSHRNTMPEWAEWLTKHGSS